MTEYEQHRVVVYPRGRGSDAYNSRRGRSLSAGRTRKSSQELVQDIYTRMGLTTTAEPDEIDDNEEDVPPEPSSPGFSSRYRGAADLTARGRTFEDTEEQRRARSLSRGRTQKAFKWPPVEAPTLSPARSFDGRPTSVRHHAWKTDDGRHTPQSLKADDAATFDTESPSIQDRISAYGKNTKTFRRSSASANTRPMDKQKYAAQFSVQPKPPKVNLYRSPQSFVSQNEEKKEEDDLEVAAVQVAAEANSRKKSTSSLADRFLNSINHGSGSKGVSPANNWSGTHAKSIAIAKRRSPVPQEISTTDPDSPGDNLSVSVSSVTGDDFGSPNLAKGAKKSWKDSRNRVAAYSSKPGMDEAAIAKLVDERVQARVAGIEARLDEKYRQLLLAAEDRWSAQLAILEAQVQGTGL